MVSAHGTNSSRHILFAENLQCFIRRKIYCFFTRMKMLIDLSWYFSRAFHVRYGFPALEFVSSRLSCFGLYRLFLYLAFYAVCCCLWQETCSSVVKTLFLFKKKTRNTSNWQLLLTIHEVKLGLRYRSDGFATDVRYFHRALSSVVQIRSSWTVQQWKGKISLSQLLLKYYWKSRENCEGYVI